MSFVDTSNFKTRFFPLLQALLFTALVVVLGHFVAQKIFLIPTRLDLLVFISVLLFIPVLKYPITGVYFLFIVPPFIGFIRRFFYLFYERPGMDLLIIIPDVIVVLLFIVLFDQLRRRIRIKNEDPVLVGWMWVFFFYQLARVYVANGSGLGTGINQFKFVALYILCFYYAIYFVKTKLQVIFIFKVTAWLGLFIAVYGLKQAFFGYTRFEEIWLDKMRTVFVTLFIEGKPRPFSTLASPASFADYMVIAQLATLALLSLESVGKKWIYMLFLPIQFFALLITSVRSNWFGLMAGVLIWFIIAHRSSIRVKLGLVLFIIMAFFLVSILMDSGGGTSVTKRSQRSMENKDEYDVTDLFVKSRTSALTSPFQEHSMISRTMMWRQVFESSLYLPQGPFGWGMGSFNAHSYYFSTLYDIGYPGFFLLLFILFRIFRAGYRVYREEEEPERRVIARGALTILFAISVMNSTGPHTSEHPADIYYWFLAGVLLVLRRLKSGGDDSLEKISDAIVDPT